MHTHINLQTTSYLMSFSCIAPHNLYKCSVPSRFRWCMFFSCITIYLYSNATCANFLYVCRYIIKYYLRQTMLPRTKWKMCRFSRSPWSFSDPRLIQVLFRDFYYMSSDGSPWYFPVSTHHFTRSHGKRHASADRWYCFSTLKAPSYCNCSFWIWISTGKYTLNIPLLLRIEV